MKKALIVTNLRGFIVFLKNDIDLLQSMGYQVFFAASHGAQINHETMEYLESKGVTFYEIGFSSKNPFAKENLTAYKQLKALIKKGKFDFIHCHTPIAGLLTRYAARKCRRKGTKVIYTTHGLSYTTWSSFKTKLVYKTIESMASRWCDAIITINEEDFENAKKLHCKKVFRISGVGVDTRRYHEVEVDIPAYRECLGIPVDKTIVLSVGELSHRKNHQVIIRALSRLPNKKEYAYVICGKEVAGSGFAQKLQDLAKELGVELYLLGHRSDIPQVMRCADIGAIPSVREGLGLAGIESLAAGVPLVGTAVQGIKDYIFPGDTGYLCAPYDVQAYADAIEKLSNSELRARMRELCYEVAKRFDCSVSHEQMRQIYTCVLLEE